MLCFSVLLFCVFDFNQTSHSVPSVLSNHEFNQKHSHRKLIKVAKPNSKKSVHPPPVLSSDSLSEESSSLLLTCDPIDEAELDMESPSRQSAEHRRNDAVKQKEREKKRRESVQGLLQVYHEQDKGVLRVQLPGLGGVKSSAPGPGSTGALLEEEEEEEGEGGEVKPPRFTSPMNDDIAESEDILSTCRKSVSEDDPKVPQSPVEEENQKVITGLVVDIKHKHTVQQEGNSSGPHGLFQQHVPSLSTEETDRRGSIDDLRDEEAVSTRNKELEHIIRLLKSGVKDSRRAQRQQIMQARRLEEARRDKERRQYARDCDLCLQRILSRMHPLVGERVVLGLRQRQDSKFIQLVWCIVS